MRSATTASPVPDRCPVELKGQTEQPLIRGFEVERLNPGQYAIIEVLVKAWPGTVSGDQLVSRSGLDRPVDTLSRLSKKTPWSDVIVMAGTAGNGYGLRRS